MTTLYKEKVKCCVCGAKNKFTGIGSTNTWGLSDLDTRPAEMKRSTMFAWVQRCPKCGYCASNIGSPLEGAKSVVRRIEYKKQLEDSACPELANSFLCKAMIDHDSKEYSAAAWALIHAAWACDDSRLADQATECRKRAADMIVMAEEHGQQVSKQEGSSTAILVDLLRRSGQFEQARQVIEKRRGSISDDIIAGVLDLEIALIDKQDPSCHALDEVVIKNEAAPIAETQEEAKNIFQYQIRPVQNEFSKARKSTKLIADINFIFHTHEKQSLKSTSHLLTTLKTILYNMLASECGTRCKAEDFIDSLYSKEPQFFWPKINYLPITCEQDCYSELLGWCLDEDDLNRIFWFLIDYLKQCHEQRTTVFFLTTQWDPKVYSIYADKIEAFKKDGVHFTFILFSFTTLRASEISTNKTTFIKRNILELQRILARFWYFLTRRTRWD